MGAVMVSSREPATASKPAVAAVQVVAAPSAAVAPQQSSEDKFVTRTWRVGATMVSSRLPLVDGLRLTLPTIRNAALASATAAIVDQVRAGGSLVFVRGMITEGERNVLAFSATIKRFRTKA